MVVIISFIQSCTRMKYLTIVDVQRLEGFGQARLSLDLAKMILLH